MADFDVRAEEVFESLRSIQMIQRPLELALELTEDSTSLQNSVLDDRNWKRPWLGPVNQGMIDFKLTGTTYLVRDIVDDHTRLMGQILIYPKGDNLT